MSGPGTKSEIDYTSRKYILKNNLTTLFDLKSQLLHTFLFAVAAGMTVFGYGFEDINYKQENKVILTNLRELSIANFKVKPAIDTKNDLMNKWLCPSNAPPTSAAMALQQPFNETWGPDNVCRCFRSKNCTTATECAALETSCYKKTVPEYAHVYAGVETPYFSILAGFLLLHISVLLNMTIEVMDNPPAKRPDNRVSQDIEVDATPLLIETVPPTVVFPGATGQSEGSRFRYFGAPGDTTVAIAAKSTDPRPDHIMLKLANALKNRAARFVLLTLLSLVVGIVTVYGYNLKTQGRGPEQKCGGEGNNLCVTETLVFVILIVVSAASTLLSGWSAFYLLTQDRIHSQDKQKTGVRMIHRTASMLEEVTLISGCMSLVAAFTAMSGVHDDTTILFDVVAVLFIGFVQSLQHKVMIMRETVIKHCQTSNTLCTDGLGKKHTLSSEVLAYFLHTRLFIFVVIVTSVYVFFERIQPTLATTDSVSTWNSYMRNVALLVSLIPNLSCDISYEFFHMREMQTSGEHKTYTGAAMWRRTIYLLYMILFLIAERVTYADRPMPTPMS